jgi:hypothetical protein
MPRPKRPRFLPGQAVMLAGHVRAIPSYFDHLANVQKPHVAKDQILRVSSVHGRGTNAQPFAISVTDGTHFWTLAPTDLKIVESSP